MKVVSIESPYRAGTDEGLAANEAYAWECLADSLHRGEAPIASHLLYPRVLTDGDFFFRRQGLDASHEWRKRCDLIAVYVGRGVSSGMQEAIDLAYREGIPVEYRTLLRGESA